VIERGTKGRGEMGEDKAANRSWSFHSSQKKKGILRKKKEDQGREAKYDILNKVGWGGMKGGQAEEVTRTTSETGEI